MNKFLYYNDLFNLYKELLTTKEKEIFALYYEENYSMGEISENLNISRSAVGNTVKIVENKLSKYESILHIKEKNEKKGFHNKRKFCWVKCWYLLTI